MLEQLEAKINTFKNNLVSCIQLSNAKFPMGLNEDEAYELIQNRTKESRVLIVENYKIINEHIKPYLSKNLEINESSYQSLFNAAQEFFNYSVQIDIGFALEIYTALIVYAQSKNDIDKIICCKYWQGLSLYYLNKFTFKNRILEIFKSVVTDYKDYYFELKDKTTRQYYNRCLGNTYLALSIERTESYYDITPFKEHCKYTYNFWTDEKVRELDKDISFDNYIINMRLNTIVFTDYIRYRNINELEVDDEILQRCYYDGCILNNLYSNVEDKENVYLYVKTYCSRMVSSYNIGLKTSKQLCDILLNVYNSAKDGIYDTVNNYKKCFIGPLYCHYIEINEIYSPEKRDKITKRIAGDILNYCDAFPLDKSPEDANSLIANAISAFSANKVKVEDDNEAFNIVLKMTIFRHLPTFVHSIMVSKISTTISRFLIDFMPHIFLGMNNYQTIGEVINDKNFILEMVEKSGMSHDIGKITYLQTLSNYARGLTNEEFDIIRNHPEFAAVLFAKDSTNKYCSDVAHGHHKWYDGTKGYPMDFDNTTSEYRTLIDIVTIADSIDAATDTTGRGYAKGLTLDELMQELNNQAGSRYSPYIVEMLKNEDLFDEIRYMLINQRKIEYYYAYSKFIDKVN